MEGEEGAASFRKIFKKLTVIISEIEATRIF